MRTSKSSKPLIKKNDAFDREKEAKFYRDYREMEIENFRLECRRLILASKGKDETKAKFERLVTEQPTKDKLCKLIVDYFYAGKGLKV